ncbi:nucleoporin Ndc1 [Scaptodrosophila lebanonensis]|uniref:Nucleoporin Ndc1 n=1 Tax=Drosophila lebanonensis TaxID=7225 RepID=A0A6J2T1R0_DROLE|nr:nucleoporin Ndc1 [Scaptodrosophila lebanonensis]
MSAVTSTNASKLLMFWRCIRAILLSVGMQYFLLTVFLLSVNFQLFHPLVWLATTLRLVCSLYTWFASIPLIGAVVLYGVILCQQHLVERRYCATRYRWLLQNGVRKALFLSAHLLVGYLTAWLYTGYLHSDYRHLIYKCYGQDCLSSYNVFLLGMGTTAGLYYYALEHLRNGESLHFYIVNQPRAQKFRELLLAALSKAPTMAVAPTLGYTFIFWLLGSLVRHKLSQLFGVEVDEQLVGILDLATNVRLLFYAWLLTVQIMSNMHLLRHFSAMLLAEDLPLVIARSRTAFVNEQELTLVSALSVFNVYVVQCVAARFFYNLTISPNSSARMEIFLLTEPGNRPANWRALCDQCLSIIVGFTDELADSISNISVVKGPQSFTPPPNDANAKILAEKILLRQYNQLHGIRPIMTPMSELSAEQQLQQKSEHIRRMPNWCERISGQLEASVQRLLQRIPFLVYFFHESEGAKTAYLLNNALPIYWLSQALAHLCVSSIKEDRYGVVQSDLPAIFKALHRLKRELDMLATAMASTTRAPNKNFNMLRCAVQRSLYIMCSSFYDYLGEVVPAGEELHQLQALVLHD